ncbi:breast cancer metastasis-suppressor 1-like protein [Eurytemora carolleeae]|uniref:breast cancer metastasis-suppressor 1-like protein n=1 Tax=Eurytemora carolleeae TaxID=1294199 RepID=UPI000C756B47|nr:breast cancer metastasis-suppressor 1-like protein [Eurytemora carolleeae]|eukprot:XP_023330133.1 breast cancer metastasis-suppressor 1-like protein [Eurytemora affinis]
MYPWIFNAAAPIDTDLECKCFGSNGYGSINVLHAMNLKVGKHSSGDESSEDGSGSDSSDMDVEEGEKRRESYIEDLTELENQFTILREQLYRERLTQIESKLAEVKAERAQEYIQPLEELQENMRIQLEVGAILRQLRQENIQCKYEAEELASKQNYESEKQLVFDGVKAELEEKTRRLEEDKNNVDFSTGLWEQSTRRNRKRKLDQTDTDRRRKPVTVSGPYIVYMLQEADILEDWTQIKKSLVNLKASEK